MRVSTKGRYSLEALLYMALLPEGTSASTRSIAENTGISDGYLEQLFIPLRKAGIVRGVRGSQGGYFPGKAVDNITVGEVLRAVEGSMEPVDCVHSKICPMQSACLSRHTWSDLYTEINKCIDTISLQDLVDAYKAVGKEEYSI